MPRSRTSVSLSQVRVGLFVLIAIAVLIFLVLNASGDINPFSKKLHLKARFVDANGLREGSEVRLAGVRVGKVEREPEIVMRGFGGADITEQARELVMKTLDGLSGEQRTDYGMVKEKVRVELKRLIQKSTGKRPMIIPVILEI